MYSQHTPESLHSYALRLQREVARASAAGAPRRPGVRGRLRRLRTGG